MEQTPDVLARHGVLVVIVWVFAVQVDVLSMSGAVFRDVMVEPPRPA
jgi:hypothetical protein